VARAPVQKKSGRLAKLTLPRLHAPYGRRRLFRRLDTFRAVPVVWIAGPPGAGKTTLAATWLEARRRPALWVQLDSADSEPATFFHYLKRAAEAAGARGKVPLPLLKPEYLGDVPGFARRWFRELFARLPAGATLALDNYQEVAAESVLHRALAAACEEIPDGAQLLALSRADPPPAYSGLLAREQLARLEPDALKLSAEEAEGIAVGKGTLTAEQARELHAQCDGWAAGFTQLQERARRTGLVNHVEQGSSMQEVFDYFMALTFADATPEARDTLIKSAMLPRFTEAMARELSGSARAGELLEWLFRRHLFIHRRYGEETTYQYHALFRAFLLDQAKLYFTPLGLADLARRAAAILERAGYAEDAVRLLTEGGDHDGAAGLVEKLAPGVVAAGRGAALRAWLNRLSEAERDRRPWLSYWLGAALTGVSPLEARSAYERAYAGFVRSADPTGQLMAVVGVLETHLVELDHMEAIQPWLRALDGLLVDEPAFPSADDAARAYGTLVELMLWAVPAHPLFPACVERLDALLAEPLGLEAKVAAASRLLEYYGFAGFAREADRLVGAIEPLMRDASVSPLTRAAWTLRSHRRDYLVGDLRACRRKLEQAATIATENGLRVLLHFIYGFQADLELTAGNLEAVPPLLEGRLATRPPWKSLGRDHWMRAKYAALRGDLHEAVREGEAACSIGAEARVTLALLAYRATLAASLAELGEHGRAREVVSLMRDVYPRRSFPLQSFSAEAAGIILAAATERPDQWCAQLRDGLRRLQDLGVAVPSRCPITARQLARIALSQGIETSYVRNWIRTVNLRPPAPDIPGWPWAVRIRTLGAFGVELDDVPLTFASKAPRKPLELLQALVAYGARGVSSETLCNAVWPDSEGDAAEAALRVTLGRLRKLLKQDGAVVLHQGKLSLDDRLCWVDVWSMERLLAEIEAAPLAGQVERLTALYRGAFLDGEREQPWMVPAREKLRRRFLGAAGKLGWTPGD
jgi:hypothetical protein